MNNFFILRRTLTYIVPISKVSNKVLFEKFVSVCIPILFMQAYWIIDNQLNNIYTN